jgi:hypothetical protein
MNRWLPRLLQGPVRRLMALVGAIGVLGAAASVEAAPLPERSALEARVADMRRHLNGPALRDAAQPTLVAQAGRWNNWPNWSNWANWRNG